MGVNGDSDIFLGVMISEICLLRWIVKSLIDFFFLTTWFIHLVMNSLIYFLDYVCIRSTA